MNTKAKPHPRPLPLVLPVRVVSGLTLSQGEDFIIKPFASQTEVVS